MPRLCNRQGVVVSVSPETAARLGSDWRPIGAGAEVEPAEQEFEAGAEVEPEPRSTRRTRK